MSSSWAFTRTAIKRFIALYARRESEEEAQKLLAARAGRLRELTATGDFQWKVEEPPLILVTKRKDGLHLCVTVHRDSHRGSPPWSGSEQELVSEMALELAGVGAGGSSRREWAQKERRLHQGETRSSVPCPPPVTLGVRPHTLLSPGIARLVCATSGRKGLMKRSNWIRALVAGCALAAWGLAAPSVSSTAVAPVADIPPTPNQTAIDAYVDAYAAAGTFNFGATPSSYPAEAPEARAGPSSSPSSAAPTGAAGSG